MLRAAEGFAALGDAGAVQNCVVMAGRLADDPDGRARVQAFAERFSAVADNR